MREHSHPLVVHRPARVASAPHLRRAMPVMFRYRTVAKAAMRERTVRECRSRSRIVRASFMIILAMGRSGRTYPRPFGPPHRAAQAPIQKKRLLFLSRWAALRHRLLSVEALL